MLKLALEVVICLDPDYVENRVIFKVFVDVGHCESRLGLDWMRNRLAFSKPNVIVEVIPDRPFHVIRKLSNQFSYSFTYYKKGKPFSH